MDFSAFDNYVDAHAEHYVARVQALCRAASIAAEQGPALGEAAGQVAALARGAGLAVEAVKVDGGPEIVLAQGGAGSRGLLVYNHYDVQPADPLDEWLSPPFEPAIRDGVLYARGTADNKGNLVARLAAAEAYRAVAGSLPLRLCFVLEGEEEVGSPHLAPFARDHAGLLRTMDGCLWESGNKDAAGRHIVTLGLKGVVSLFVSVQTAACDTHSGFGGLYPNAAWRLVEALSTLRRPDGVVTVDGLNAHVRPPSEAELAAVAGIPFAGEETCGQLGMPSLLGGLDGIAVQRRLMFEPTCTINGMWSGHTGRGSKTVIPARAFARLDLRLVPDLTPGLVLRLVREHLAKGGFDDVTVEEEEEGLLPARTDPTAPVVRAATAALTGVTGQPPLVHPTSPGSGPMHQLCTAYGIPAVSFGVGWAESNVHGPNESIRVADYLEGIKVMGRFIHAFAAA